MAKKSTAAAKKGKTGKDANKKKRGPGLFGILRNIIVFVLLVVVLGFATMLVVLGMLPAFVASYVDTSPGRNAFRVILSCNFAGVFPFLMRLYDNGPPSSDEVYDLIFTPYVWLVMYGSAAFGWGLVWFFPRASHYVLNRLQDTSIKALQDKQQAIVDEWGLEVESASRRALRNILFSEERKNRARQQVED
jgi:hypothetical protein